MKKLDNNKFLIELKSSLSNKKLIVIGILLVTAIILVKGGIDAGIIGDIGGKDYPKKGLNSHMASKGDGEYKSGSEDGQDEAATENSSENIRYHTFPIESKVLDKDSYYDYSNAKLAWYMVRNENHEPTGCDETIDIYKYAGYHVDKKAKASDKVLYLTFDCGYDNGYTEQMLDVLKKHNVPACFFVTQTYIRDNIELTKRMKEEGHQVGNHTVTHPSMPEESYEEILEEVTGCADYMVEATGYAMDPYLRPPMGEYSERTLKITQDLGYKNIFWSMAYMDYDVNNQPGVDYVTAHFEKYHHNGAIILMHNVSSSNAGALETVIINMKAKGYRFASLNELK